MIDKRPSENLVFDFQTAFCQPKKGKSMKPMTALVTAAVFSALSLNACGDSGKSMSIQE